MFENKNPPLSILFLETSKNHKPINTENKKPAEAWQYTFPPESLELTSAHCELALQNTGPHFCLAYKLRSYC